MHKRDPTLCSLHLQPTTTTTLTTPTTGARHRRAPSTYFRRLPSSLNVNTLPHPHPLQPQQRTQESKIRYSTNVAASLLPSSPPSRTTSTYRVAGSGLGLRIVALPQEESCHVSKRNPRVYPALPGRVASFPLVDTRLRDGPRINSKRRVRFPCSFRTDIISAPSLFLPTATASLH